MRYGQQPVDGAHVGTSPTRDVLLLIDAKRDKSAKVLEYKPLTKSSASAAGTNHPALMSLQRGQGDGAKLPSIRNNEEHDWWIVRLQSKAKAGATAKDLKLDLVVAGQAAE